MAEETKELKFKCPECGCTTIEEVVVDVSKESCIKSIRKAVKANDVEVDYKPNPRFEEGDAQVLGYRCFSCDTPVEQLGEGWDEPVQNEYDLAYWIEENCPQD